MKFLTHNEVSIAAKSVAHQLMAAGLNRAYPIPRGGIPAAYAVQQHHENLVLVDNPAQADCYIDDIIDSGATAARYTDKPFFPLFNKKAEPDLPWIVFPWEGTVEASAEDIVVRLLQFLGEDSTREGLKETPARFLKAWRDYWGRGYRQNPADIMKVFEDGAEGCNEMILVKSIPLFSHCEHHLAPIVGHAHVAYIPNGKIIGLSKIPRLVEIYARRLQVQERLGNQIADAMMEYLQPKGCAVLIEARHLCMESRGIERIGASTTTSALRGVFMDEPETRAEFFSMVRR